MLSPRLAENVGESNEVQRKVARYVYAILEEVKRMILPDHTGTSLVKNVHKQKICADYVSRIFSLRTSTATIQIMLDTRKAVNDNEGNRVTELCIAYIPKRALGAKLTDQNSGNLFSPGYVELRVHLFADKPNSLQWLFEVMSRGKQGINQELWPLVVYGGDDAIDEQIGQRHSITVASDPSLIDAEEHATLIAKNDTLASDSQIDLAIPVIDAVAHALFQAGEQLEISTCGTKRSQLQAALKLTTHTPNAA